MRVDTITQSAIANPSSYDSGYQAYSFSDLTNGCADASSTTYATVNLTRGYNAQTFIFYNFNVNIPAGATINSVACAVKCRQFNGTYTSSRSAQLFSGSTAKGDATTLPSNATPFNIANCGSWTASELSSVKLRLFAQRSGTSNTNTCYFRFYGATLTVNYTYNQTVYTITCTSTAPNVHVGNATDYTHTYEVAEGHNQNIELVGDMTGAVVTDNDVDITSSVTPMSGGAVISLTNVQADRAILIFIPQTGDKIFVKVNTTWKEAQDVKVKVNGTWQSVSKAYKMVGGSWVEQSDKSAMFDPNALYLKG